eukprot:TRINITY_DN10433_c0_g1_i1.p1 TRINITY_DN10433_c0_g1~~TRINITY_DN10433_c0_g1_i1.p1  ORF type:complete len:409 (+),score=72.59 TRINITY_DN10433_c0_g1_i1:50-1276(+)
MFLSGVGRPSIENTVREATHDDGFKPSPSLLNQLAVATHDPYKNSIILSYLWKRLGDHGKNWKRIFKALYVLEYIALNGSPNVLAEASNHRVEVQTHTMFQHAGRFDGKDIGLHVREKAKAILDLIDYGLPNPAAGPDLGPPPPLPQKSSHNPLQRAPSIPSSNPYGYPESDAHLTSYNPPHINSGLNLSSGYPYAHPPQVNPLSGSGGISHVNNPLAYSATSASAPNQSYSGGSSSNPYVAQPVQSQHRPPPKLQHVPVPVPVARPSQGPNPQIYPVSLGQPQPTVVSSPQYPVGYPPQPQQHPNPYMSQSSHPVSQPNYPGPNNYQYPSPTPNAPNPGYAPQSNAAILQQQHQQMLGQQQQGQNLSYSQVKRPTVPVTNSSADPFAATANDPFAATANDPFGKQPF